MRQSPRRPLILKRRKLPFPSSGTEQPPRDVPAGVQRQAAPAAPGRDGSLDLVRIVDHPSMADTQVVVVPKTADLRRVVDALSAKGKERGSQGPNKFILLSGGSGGPEEDWPGSLGLSSLGLDAGDGRAFGTPLILKPEAEAGNGTDSPVDTDPLTAAAIVNKSQHSSPLNDSLTNIQWLGGMRSDSLGSDAGRSASDKENQEPCAQRPQLPQLPQHVTEAQRPPYSYMAMIQFAINSKQDRRMTLKEIYTWIEDHFPYFRDVAKPGWKNSIRHNLSLHDMFTRETSADGKISFWTIRPEANRCLTLDQVYRQVAEPSTPPSTQVCEQQQLKPPAPQIKRAIPPISSDRKMKPLLPRADSYLVPVQLSLNPSLFLPSPQLPLVAPQRNCGSSAAEFQAGGKRVRIAPKCTQPPVEEFKEEPLFASLTHETPVAPPPHTRRGSRGSRRKQCLAPPSREEPVLLFPDSTFFDSGLTSDFSQDTGLDSPGRAYAFKTPVKGRRPTSSTPSKPLAGHSPASLAGPWRTSPRGGGEGRDVLEFSPIRSPPGYGPAQQNLSHTPFSFGSTPFREPALFSSPSELLASPGPDLPRAASLEPPAGGATASANRSITEGLVLDTMNDSLSKILVDISFSALEDEELDVCNLSWSQFIPEFK